jgi:hypothetical protein
VRARLYVTIHSGCSLPGAEGQLKAEGAGTTSGTASFEGVLP